MDPDVPNVNPLSILLRILLEAASRSEDSLTAFSMYRANKAESEEPSSIARCFAFSANQPAVRVSRFVVSYLKSPVYMHHLYASAGRDKKGRPALIPFYEQINQTGLDLQMVAGQWLWKLESLYRTGQGEGYFGSVGGAEYTLVGITETGMDLGLIGEYAYDERGDAATTVYENDAMFGLRLAVNDADGTELLAGLIQDLDSPARSLTVEASRRFGSNWKLSMQAWGFLDSPSDDLLFSARDDDYLQIELSYYF